MGNTNKASNISSNVALTDDDNDDDSVDGNNTFVAESCITDYIIVDPDGSNNVNTTCLPTFNTNDIQAKSNIAPCLTDDLKSNNKNKKIKKVGRWPDSIVPYVIDNNVENGLKILIEQAIKEFNNLTPVQWKKKTLTDVNYVSFEQTSDVPCTTGPCLFEGKQLIQLSYPYILPSYSKMKKIGVMHEMMHSLGFLHEHQRMDAKDHHKTSIHEPWDLDFQLCGHVFGNYDYLSIMHYQCGSIIQSNTNTRNEMHKYVGKSSSFSRGDLAALRRIYGKYKYAHYGQWHNKCTNIACNKYTCHCGSCGRIESGDVWCGFHGKKNDNGHWTCCFDENKLSNECKDKNKYHTGFWHMPCMNDKCTDTHCVCGSCGGGCKYIGKKAHWSCCNQDDFKSHCNVKNSFYANQNSK